MDERKPAITHQLNSPQVLFRFLFRLILLITFASFGSLGFGATFATLMTLSALLCASVGAMRPEAIFGPVLTHWDEAAAYAVMGRLATAFS